MSWEDRLQTARYIAPSGATFEFIYEGVSVEVEKKTTEFTYPDVDGSYIQDLGRAGRKFPFTLFFTGEDHDTDSDDFLLALEETGVGKLEHPFYGDRNVVPTGSITRSDNLTSGANQTSFSVTFSETITDIVYPSDFEGQEKKISDNADTLQESAAAEFASGLTTDNVSEGISIAATGASSSSFINDAYSDFVSLNESVNSGFIAIASSYASNVTNILTDPSGVVQQAILLTRLPSQIETTSEGMTDVYNNAILTLQQIDLTPDNSNNPTNDFLLYNALVSGNVTGLCEGLLNSEITTRTQAVTAAETLVDIYESTVAWRDEHIASLGIIDTPSSYFDLLQIVTDTAVYLISESFDLPNEIIVRLQNDRNLIEFLSSVGLDVETNFDNFIQWNDLTADTIEILEKDMEVIYYV